MEHTDFGTIVAAAGIANVPVEISRNIKLKDIKFTNREFSNSIEKNVNAITSLRIVPNKNYDEKDIYSLFNFKIDTKRRELDIYLFNNKSEPIDKYPFNFHLAISNKGNITFQINGDFSGKISDRIFFNKIMGMWNEKGLRRLRIHGLRNDEIFETVPDKIDVTPIKYYEETFRNILNTADISTDELPYIISDSMINKINELGSGVNDKEICENLLEEYKTEISKEQTKLFLLLKSEEGDILFSICLGIIPYFINLDFIKMKPCNAESKDIINKVFKRENGIKLEKFLFDDKMYDYFMKVIDIVMARENPVNPILDLILNSIGSYPTGKGSIEIKEKQDGFWSSTQNITFTFQIADKEIENRDKLHKLLSEEKFIEAIPLMELKEDKNLEDLAFAYYIKGDYKKSLEICEKSIKYKYDSIAHFTKGLVYLVEENYDKAYEAYMLGMYLVKPDIWYPEIKENIKIAIDKGKIIKNERVKEIFNKIELCKRLRKSGKELRNCFCGSKKKFYSCHGKQYRL